MASVGDIFWAKWGFTNAGKYHEEDRPIAILDRNEIDGSYLVLTMEITSQTPKGFNKDKPKAYFFDQFKVPILDSFF